MPVLPECECGVVVDNSVSHILPFVGSHDQPLASIKGGDLCSLPAVETQANLAEPSDALSLPQVAQRAFAKQRSKKRRRVLPQIRPPCLRPEANADLPQIASMYGADLIDVPSSWMSVENALHLLTSMSILIWTAHGTAQVLQCESHVFLLELFAGCWHLTHASIEAGYPTGPSVDILPAFGGGSTFDILTPAGRQLVWALLICLQPQWVHCGYPCTFWSPLAHCTRKRSGLANEKTRLESLVYIRFFHSRFACGNIWQAVT